MLLRRAILLLSAISSSLAAPLLNKRAGPTRGVNLGGWLVLEPWITPSIFHKYDGFTIVDEYTLCQNDPNAAAVLQAHWSSWITLADFQKIAATNKGINTVRIPVGYWAFQKYPGDTYVQGAKDYLAQALDWASQTGLKVWIDLHGAPLSQNGFDNSGRRGGMAWTSADTISFTAGVISQVAGEFGNHPAVAGIELVNEPMMGSLPGGRSAVENYYGQGDAAVHAASGAGVIIHDGFDDPGSWAGIDPDTTIDHHAYQVFTSGDLELTYQQHADTAYGRATSWTNSGRNVVVGEWTAAMTDCAPALNGYGIGARYDGTYSAPGLSSYFIGSCAIQNFIDEWTPELKAGTTQFIQAQMNAYETNLGGWIFWTVKTEASAEWDFFRLVDNGVWP